MSEFKVGDLVVLLGYMSPESSSVIRISNIGKYDLSFENRDDLHINAIHGWNVVIRHATPQEIEAGHRL